jgi:TrkA domain protein
MVTGTPAAQTGRHMPVGASMRIDRTTVPGNGVLHHIVTRDGERFCLLVDADSTRRLLTYGDSDPDVPAQSIVLDADEADQVAEILHSQPIADRLVSLE